MRSITPDTIFVSHSQPEDTYFAAWLASKLKLLGYKVWIETDELKSGDAFWPAIEEAIRNHSVKFLAIVSDSFMQKVSDPNSGIFKELSCADRIKDIKNFKVPVRLHSINHDDFPVQLMGLNAVDFYGNWQSGLDQLLDSFKKEQIYKNEETANNPLNFWLEAFKIDSKITTDPETVYTNWFPFALPSTLYIHKIAATNRIDLVDIAYTYLDYSDRQLSFFPAKDYPPSIEVVSSVELQIHEIIQRSAIPIDDFLTLSEPRKKIVQLINKTVEEFFIQSKMKKHEQASTNVYYFPTTDYNRKRISLKHLGKTNVAITGKTGKNYWSFGISSFCMLFPKPYLKIGSHIVMENSEQVVFDADEHHTLRRKFSFDWYNRDWLDTLLGIVLKLASGDADHMIRIPISADRNLEIDSRPLSMETDFGYHEPVKEEKDETENTAD